MTRDTVSLTITEETVGRSVRVEIYFKSLVCDDEAAYTIQVGSNTYESVVSVACMYILFIYIFNMSLNQSLNQ